MTATARKLACIVYQRLKYQEEYVPISEAAHEANAQAQRLERLRREARKLGLELVQAQKAAWMLLRRGSAS